MCYWNGFGMNSMMFRSGVQQEHGGIRAKVVYVAVSVYTVAQISIFGDQYGKMRLRLHGMKFRLCSHGRFEWSFARFGPAVWSQ